MPQPMETTGADMLLRMLSPAQDVTGPIPPELLTPPNKEKQGPLDGIEPVGELVEHPKSGTRPKIELNFPDEALGQIEKIILERNVINSIGWAMSKQGKMEFFVPKMEDASLFNQRFDESGVIGRWRQGGYDSVFMIVLAAVSRGNIENFYESSKKIQESLDEKVPMYIVSMNPIGEHMVHTKAFRFNPAVDDDEINAALELGQRVSEDHRERQNRLTHELQVTYDSSSKSAHDVVVSSMRRRAKFATEYIRLKFGDEEVAKKTSLTVNNEIPGQITECVRARSDYLTQATSMICAEQAFFGMLFQKTGLVEGIEISNIYQGVMGLSKDHQQTVVAVKALSEGLEMDEDKGEIVWAIAGAANPIEDKAAILKPLVVACIEEKLEPNPATLNTIYENSNLIGICAEQRPEDDPEYDFYVSMVVAQGRAREALWKKVPMPGLNESDQLSAILKDVFVGTQITKDIKGQLRESIEASTERTLDELLKSDELLEIHGTPLSELLGTAFSLMSKFLVSEIEQAEDNVEIIGRMSDPELRQKYAKGTKRQRAKFKPAVFRKRAEADVRNNMELKERFDELRSRITVGEDVVTLLETLAGETEGGIKSAEHITREWAKERSALDEVPIVDLFPGTTEKKRALEKAALEYVYGLTSTKVSQTRVGEEARALVRDSAFVSGVINGTMGAGRFGRDAKTILEHLNDYANVRAREWNETDITAENLPTLAREVALTDYCLGSKSDALDGVVERIPEKLRPDYEAIMIAYVDLINNLPDEMKLI